MHASQIVKPLHMYGRGGPTPKPIPTKLRPFFKHLDRKLQEGDSSLCFPRIVGRGVEWLFGVAWPGMVPCLNITVALRRANPKLAPSLFCAIRI